MDDLQTSASVPLAAGRATTPSRLERLALENHLLLDTVPVGIVFVRQRTILRCNRRFEQIFGHDPNELDGLSTRVLYPDDDAFELGRQAYVALAVGRTHEREQVLVRKDGTRFWCRLYGRAMNIARPAEGSVWLFEDISERKADEEHARRLLYHYQAIFENASTGILFTRDRVCESCNPRFAAMFGYPDPQALAGQPASVLHRSADDYAEMARVAGPVLSRGDSLDLELEMRRSDDTPIWVHLCAKAIVPGNPSRGTIWIADDVTARRAAEHVLRQTLLEQDAIFENASAGIVFLKDRVIQRCNRRFADLFGYAPVDVLGQTTRLFYGSADEYEFGATPYPFLARGESHAREQQLVRGDGSRFWCRLTGRAVDPTRPEQQSVWLLEDVTEQRAARELLELRVQQRTAELALANAQLQREVAERQQAEGRVRHLAHHDELTGLPNRRLLLDRLAQALALARRAGEHVAVMFVDLDRFKTINDSLGHAVGDELLRDVAQRISGILREADTVARLGGDEFVLVLPRVTVDSHVAVVAQKLLDTLAAPFRIEEHELHVTPSIGVALFPDDGDTPQTLLRNADAAMYHAKQAGRNNYQFFALQMNVSAALRLELENDLHHALERDELFLEYQPRIDLEDGRLLGFEALVRWRHPRQGVVYPDDFIPLAEETGLVTQLGEWVLERACRQVLQWQREGMQVVPVAVNLSPRQFRQRRIAERIGAILTGAGVAPHLIELEITETTLMHNTDQTLATLEALHRMGLRMAIDDFGTGYSSLSYLKRFPVAQLKVDRSFVRELDGDVATAAIVSAIAMLGDKLGLKVVAEGVETKAQLEAARRCGCHQAQGHLFSRPVSADDVPALCGRDWLAHVGRGGERFATYEECQP